MDYNPVCQVRNRSEKEKLNLRLWFFLVGRREEENKSAKQERDIFSSFAVRTMVVGSLRSARSCRDRCASRPTPPLSIPARDHSPRGDDDDADGAGDAASVSGARRRDPGRGLKRPLEPRSGEKRRRLWRDRTAGGLC